MFTKLLVANRGEIAKRIFTACRELGITSVAIFSEADAGAAWTLAADEAYPLGGLTATDSYLNQQKIFEIATGCGAEAIHPGFGFLSENADFAQACADHGLKFVGPSPAAMRLMGSKASARQIAVQAGVPVTPGVDGADLSPEALQAAAAEIGYPVLIKASAGGGGKGMRVVDAPPEFLSALQAARTEAANSFGDDRVILEKYLTTIHHIEIQILGDEHGKVLHFFERECSIQRRHQKIIEETPSPTISDAMRHRIATAAVSLAKKAGYFNAGTVEFMYTRDRDGSEQFYLLEMNTRLQVEHPITELVTGIDLAQWQIRVAAGQPLPFEQAEIRQRGHALECRIYAEDPANQFLPSIDTVSQVTFPVMPNVRIDAGIATGEAVTPYYDPMLAKIITYGASRIDAIERMLTALKETVLLGVTSNIPYLIDILSEPEFRAGRTTTGYLTDHFDGWTPSTELDPAALAAIAALELVPTGSGRQHTAGEGAPPVPDPWSRDDGWRI